MGGFGGGCAMSAAPRKAAQMKSMKTEKLSRDGARRSSGA